MVDQWIPGQARNDRVISVMPDTDPASMGNSKSNSNAAGFNPHDT